MHCIALVIRLKVKIRGLGNNGGDLLLRLLIIRLSFLTRKIRSLALRQSISANIKRVKAIIRFWDVTYMQVRIQILEISAPIKRAPKFAPK